MAQRLWQEPGFDPAKLRRLEYLGDRRRAQSGRADRALHPRRHHMSNGFGMSETGSNYGMPMDDPDLVVAKGGSCGLPYAFVETRIADEEGNELPPGETGELWLAGPSVTPGYWNRPEENERAFSGKWFKTGDAALVDEDGYLYVVDRRKDMYISGGENVFPAEVEAALRGNGRDRRGGGDRRPRRALGRGRPRLSDPARRPCARRGAGAARIARRGSPSSRCRPRW